MKPKSRNKNPQRVGQTILLACCLGFTAVSTAADLPDDTVREISDMTVLRWQASAMGQSVFGSACWLSLPDGSWRLSIADNGPASEIDELCLTHNIYETGQGWTLVPSAAGSTIVMPWRREFRDYGHQTTVLLELAMVLFDLGPQIDVENLPPGVEILGSMDSRRRSFQSADDGAGKSQLRLLLPPGKPGNPFDELFESDDAGDAAGGSFRDRMQQRGMGRGDERETWSVSWSETGGRRHMNIASSRRAGTLELERVATYLVSYLPDEVLMPVWPLADLIYIDRNTKK